MHRVLRYDLAPGEPHALTTYPERAGRFAATAAELGRLQGASDEVAVLEAATASLVETGYDNWNGGTTYYTFMLELPVHAYARLEPRRDELEKAILARVRQLNRVDSENVITEVVISPSLSDDPRPARVTGATDGVTPEEVPSFWQPGFFRLFISHLAKSRVAAHQLKEALATFQIAAFVAHDDILPTREWQAEIESALRTMDALVALVEPDFVNSCWCDQEVGVAIGRGKLVVPLRAGADPHGFMGKYQGIPASAVEPGLLAKQVFDALIAHTLSTERITEAMVERTIKSNSYAEAHRHVALLEKAPRLTQLQITRLIEALTHNDQLSGAWGVRVKIQELAKRIG